ncbi:MAG: phenylalanine--tRNA ligase subunit beta [Pantoea sp. Brub]|nr:phenylalanine--tRNA ligase subunit beta [Pantoea sp. Brub]
MKFSEMWLRELVNPPINITELSEQITMSGIEVECVYPVSDLLCDIVIGEIIECKNKCDSDIIKFVKVNINNGNVLNIISNAPNCRHGLKVAVATIGAKLPKNCIVKKMELYGLISEGVLCSFSTLGLTKNESDIIEFPIDAPIGLDVYNYLKLNDNIVEVNITPNRADCLSIMGIARDVAALNNLSINTFKINPVLPKINDNLITIHIDAEEACPRYLSRIVKDININATTPLWMKEKLRRCGINSVNVLLDINNYILLEWGQPLNVFDLDIIDGNITVRMAKEYELFVLQNNKNIKLNKDILIMSDESKILSLAGIYGNEYSNINKNTKNILVECAYFNPSIIAKSIRACGLNSESSRRYERGVDFNIQYTVLERVTQLILDICGGQTSSIIDNTCKKLLPSKLSINLYRKNIDRLIGYSISDNQIVDILFRLGFHVTLKINKWKVIVPSWRFDIHCESDLIEEIVRIFGYENIPKIPIYTNLISFKSKNTHLSLQAIKNCLVNRGYQEIVTYSFVNPIIQELIHPKQKAFKILNPISEEMSVMRLSLWNGLIKTAIYNKNRQQNTIRLFETGLCFTPNKNNTLGVDQKFLLAGILSGNRFEEHWDMKSRKIDFYDLKGDLESLFNITHMADNIHFCNEFNWICHPKCSSSIYLNNQKIGSIGLIHPHLKQQLKLKDNFFLFEIEWHAILEYNYLSKIKTISCFPSNKRDISIIVNENVPIEDIINTCKGMNINQLINVKLIDLYTGIGIANGFKSVTISLIVQDINKTLKEEEIIAIIEKCIMALKKRFKVTLRD